ncbi:HAD family hydrolase [Streptococcus ovis]
MTWCVPSGITVPNVLFPEVATVLEKLAQSYHLGIIANQGEQLKERLENFGVLPYFEVIVGSADVGLRKPDVAIFDYALTQAGVLPEEAIYVGDRIDNDMVPAKKLGMTTIWIQQGLGKYNQESLEFPCDDRIEKVSDLLKIL